MPTIYVLSQNKKNNKKFLLKNINFYNLKNLCILHGHVFVMNVLSEFLKDLYSVLDSYLTKLLCVFEAR